MRHMEFCHEYTAPFNCPENLAVHASILQIKPGGEGRFMFGDHRVDFILMKEDLPNWVIRGLGKHDLSVRTPLTDISFKYKSRREATRKKYNNQMHHQGGRNVHHKRRKVDTEDTGNRSYGENNGGFANRNKR